MTTSTQSPTAPVTMDLSRTPVLSTPAEWTAFWTLVKQARAGGWKPSANEKATLDVVYKAGRTSGLARRSETPAKAEGEQAKPQRKVRRSRAERLPSGKHTSLSIFVSAGNQTVRAFHGFFPDAPAAYKAVQEKVTALRQQAAEVADTTSTLRVLVKDHLLSETWQAIYSVQAKPGERFHVVETGTLRRNPKAHGQPAEPAAKRLSKPSLAQVVKAPADKPAPAKHDAVKQALGAALQGLNAVSVAIQAAIAAL